MGSNMQRQAVPLLMSQAPIVGTGIERRAAVDSRALIIAKGKGVVEFVDGNSIVIRYDRNSDEDLVSFDTNVVTYKIPKFRRTNQSTCVNLKPIVKTGDKVEEGSILVEGYSTQSGELALGKNLLVAFMPWGGYNYEDSILINEKILAQDVFTTIHIENYEVEARDTKLGKEEITRDIPALATPGRVVGVAGTIVTVAAVEIGLSNFDDDVLNGFVLTKDAAEDVFRTLATENHSQRILNPGLPAERSDIIVAGCCILVATMRRLHIDEIIVSTRNLLDGVIERGGPRS
jgi:DNA-directed RNA polymerase beta subunit